MDRGRIEILGRLENQIYVVAGAVFLVYVLWRSSALLAVLLLALAIAVGPRSGSAFLRCLGLGAGVGIVTLWRHNVVLSVFPLLACGVIQAVRRRGTLVTICVGAIVVGFMAETLAVDNGAWTYAIPNFGPLPVWVGPMWDACVVVMTQFARSLLVGQGAGDYVSAVR